MTRSERVPDSVWIAGIGIAGTQLVQLAATSFRALTLIEVGITAGVVVLLTRGSGAGWALAAFWAAAEVSAPLVFGAPVWVSVIGLGVGVALATRSARGYCFNPRPDTARPSRASSLARDTLGEASHTDHLSAERGGWSVLRDRLAGVRISSKYAFLGFLIGTLVLLPATGLLERLDHGSGRGNSFVDVSYHAVSAASTLVQVGLIVTLVLVIRSAVR